MASLNDIFQVQQAGVNVLNKLLLTLSPQIHGAALHTNPGNPTGTASTVAKMMGLGATCILKPSYSGRVQVSFNGNITNTAAFTSTVSAYYGTGTAPANAATLTGTAIGASQTGTGTDSDPFCLIGLVTGLTLGATYWFDVALATSNGAGTASITSIAFCIHEF